MTGHVSPLLLFGAEPLLDVFGQQFGLDRRQSPVKASTALADR
jgi:hypothetical protein